MTNGSQMIINGRKKGKISKNFIHHTAIRRNTVCGVVGRFFSVHLETNVFWALSVDGIIDLSSPTCSIILLRLTLHLLSLFFMEY